MRDLIMAGRSPSVDQEASNERLGLTDLLEVSDLLLHHQVFRFRVASWSMYPTVRKGDELLVEPVSPSQIRLGDLLVFHDRGRLLCHRLVAVDMAGSEPRLLTKGDAATACDAPLEPGRVLGRVTAVKRGWLWFGRLAVCLDRWRERFIHWVARGLGFLQNLRGYRWAMRALLSRCFVYEVGTPHGQQWYHYQRVRSGQSLEGLQGSPRFHLIAKLADTCVGSMRVAGRPDGYWLQALYVRTPFRGLGVAAQLLTFACHLAALSETGRLLATVEAEHRAALRLFNKMGFRPLMGSNPCGAEVLVRELLVTVGRDGAKGGLQPVGTNRGATV